MIVLDASAWVRALVDSGPEGAAARDVLSADPDWAGPSHLPVETLRVLSRLERQGLLAAGPASELARAVVGAAVTTMAVETDLLGFVWRHRHDLSAYDAVYAGLAVRLGVPLVTSDRRLARAAEAVGATTVVPGGD